MISIENKDEWIYQGRYIDILEDCYGFVYCITNMLTRRKYIGRKYLTRIAYKTVNAKRKKIRKESDWKDYYGSSEELKKDIELLGKENFMREILHLCKTRGICNYMELKEIIVQKALESDEYYNSWISARIHKSHLKNLE